jgi:hypothetical protein
MSSRVPCKICAAQILPAVAEQNDGLCGQCVKGNRPCKYCGERVVQPLSDGTFAHPHCAKAIPTAEVSLDWETADDIDWTLVERVVHAKLTALFAQPPNPCPQCELIFWIDANGGFNFDVYQVLPNRTQLRFGDVVPGWLDDLAPFDDAFNAIIEELPQDDLDTNLVLEARLRDVVRAKCQELERKNFGYPAHTKVTWKIKDDA